MTDAILSVWIVFFCTCFCAWYFNFFFF